MQREKFIQLMDELLQPKEFKDHCHNGLQIEGRPEIHKIVTSVSACQALIDYAAEINADAIITHHGIIWNDSSNVLTGFNYKRIASVIKHDINYFGYHLPLDNHPRLGNNRQLAEVLQIEVEGQSAEQEFLWYGKLVTPMVLSEFIEHYQECTGHKPVFFGDKEKLITTIAWCTGGAQGMLHDAIKLGVDCYISGEVSEYTMSVSDESGVAYVAGGHYVTERYGIIALTEYLNEQGFDAEFLELYNPI